MLGPNGDSETLRPAEVDPAIVIQRRRSGNKVIAPVVIAAALIVTSVSWIRLSADANDTAATRTEAASKRPAAAAVAAPEAVKPAAPQVPVATEPAPSPAEAASAATSAEPSAKPPSPGLAGAFAAALNKTATSVVVTVRTVPPAILFESGKRIGSGTVDVNVEPARKLRLTALLDDHAPQNFTLDGSKPSVTIMMKPVGKNTASFPPAGATKSDGAASDSTPAKKGATPPTAEFGDPLNDVVQ